MKSCLIVDDSHIVRKVAKRIIEDLGFTCIEAEDGQIAHDICINQMPDAILLDWNMPNMTGIDLIKKLRAMDGGDMPRVVFCTAEGGTEYSQNAMNAGANGYIVKPFDGHIIADEFKKAGIL